MKNSLIDLCRILSRIEAEYGRCVRCGMCQEACPVFRYSKTEPDAPRGKLALIDALRLGILNDPGAVKKKLDRCLLCGSCSLACPRGVNIAGSIIDARMMIHGYLGLSPVNRLLFRMVLADPARFRRLLDLIGSIQDLLVWIAKKKQDTIPSSPMTRREGMRGLHGMAAYAPGPEILLPGSAPIIKARHLPKVMPEPFCRTRIRMPDRNQRGIKVYFFAGCLIDRVLPDVGDSMLNIFDKAGIDTIVSEQQGCCGMPAASSGDNETLERLAEYHFRQFSKMEFDYLVSGCPTCIHTIKSLWPKTKFAMRRNKEWFDDLANKSIDFCNFASMIFSDEAAQDKIHEGPIVAYHDSCHLKNCFGLVTEPRHLILSLTDCRLVEIPGSSSCCGMGGEFSLRHPDISLSIGGDLADRIRSVDPEILATACPACMLQFAEIFLREKGNLQIFHLAQVIDRFACR